MSLFTSKEYPELNFAIAVNDSSSVLVELTKGDMELTEKPLKLGELHRSNVVRRMVIELFSVFNECRQLRDVSERLNQDEALSLSRRYRSVLLQAAQSSTQDQFSEDFALWYLYESVYLNKGDGSLCMDLMQWSEFTSQYVNNLVDEAVAEWEEGVDIKRGKYWHAVSTALLSCRFDLCSNLLSLLESTDSATSVFLDCLSSFNPSFLLDEAKAKNLNAWKNMIQEHLKGGSFSSSGNISSLARLLLGDRNLLAQVARKLMTEWWQLLPFYIFITDPHVEMSQLGSIATECRAIFGLDESTEAGDTFFCVVALDDVNFYKNIIKNPWLSVHLIDIVYRVTGDATLHDLKSFLLFQYSNSLITHSSLWEIGVEYLLECGAEGLLRLESHIENVHIDSEEAAERLFEIAENHGLQDSKTCVTNTMRNRYLSRGEWSAALGWALRSGTKKIVENTVKRIIIGASEGELAELGVLEALPESSICKLPSLTFLFSLHRFMSVLQQRDVNRFLEHLIPLIMMPDVPPEFQYDLFDYLILVIREDVSDRVNLPVEVLQELSVFLAEFTTEKKKVFTEEFKNKVNNLKKMVMLKLAQSYVRRPLSN